METTEHYWDCECKDDYIHYKETHPYCRVCGTLHHDQPDSIISEVIQLLKIPLK